METSQTKIYTNDKDYWEDRYASGGTSGKGSYGEFAEYKASVINSVYSKNALETVLEIGCGDGNQLTYYNFSSYKGIDVSEKAVETCRQKFKKDKTKSFELCDKEFLNKYDLVLCIEVLMHITDENIFKETLDRIFNSAEKFVVIQAPLFAHQKNDSRHLQRRNLFTYLDHYLNEFYYVDLIFSCNLTLLDRLNGIDGNMISDFIVMRKKA